METSEGEALGDVRRPRQEQPRALSVVELTSAHLFGGKHLQFLQDTSDTFN